MGIRFLFLLLFLCPSLIEFLFKFLSSFMLTVREQIFTTPVFSRTYRSALKERRFVFWNSIHLEVASGPFSLLINSPWLLVFVLILFSLFFSYVNLYWWKGI